MTSVPRRQIFVRPRSEVITVLDWQQVPNERPGQWKSETCLDSVDSQLYESEEHKIKSGYVCGSYEFTHDAMGESESEMTEEFAETEFPGSDSEVKRSVLTVNLKPTDAQVKPMIAKAQSMANLPRKEENVDLQEKQPGRYGLSRRKGSLDVSLAKLRHEMNSLRRQDLELLEQLLNLNNSIQDFKLSQHASLFDSSDDSDSSEMLMEKPLKPNRWHSRGSLGSGKPDQFEKTMEIPPKPRCLRSRGGQKLSDTNHQDLGSKMEKPLKPKRWHSRGSLQCNGSDRSEITIRKQVKPMRWLSRGSLGSDESDNSDMTIGQPLTSKRWRSRGSLGSDGSDYHSASSRSSYASGSNPSLCGSDVSSYDSGLESGVGLKSCRRQSKGKFGLGDLRRVSFGNVMERSGSEVFLNGSEVVFPTQAVRRNSDFRVAEIKPIKTLSKRQSTIW